MKTKANTTNPYCKNNNEKITVTTLKLQRHCRYTFQMHNMESIHYLLPSLPLHFSTNCYQIKGIHTNDTVYVPKKCFFVVIVCFPNKTK